MRLEGLTSFVEALDPTSLREVARHCLRARGFEPSLSDGPNDGGVDFLLYLVGNLRAPMAVQVSTEKRWSAKLLEDAQKASKLGISDLLFVSSRRIPNTDFQGISDRILGSSGVRVQKMDQQDIAGLALDKGFHEKILAAHGIHLQRSETASLLPPDLRRDVAYACAFFSSDAREFRKTAVTEAIFMALVKGGGKLDRDALIDQVSVSLGLSENQRALVQSAIDRLLQEGRLHGKNGKVRIEERELASRQAMQSIQQANAEALRRDIEEVLAQYGKKGQSRDVAVEAIGNDLGALLMATASGMSAEVDITRHQDRMMDGVRTRLGRLESTLASLGIPAENRKPLLQELAHRASSSSFGKQLVAGELMIHLLDLQTSHLVRALQGRDTIEVVLDTPVSMPMLCNLLYGPASQELFVASQHLYDQMLAHRIRALVPRVYLEEIASHLIEAYRNYQEIIDLDPDLRASENAFVAHYVSIRIADSNAVGSFSEYLRDFGLNEALARGDFYVARDTLMRRLEATLGQYHLRCVDLPTDKSSRRWAEDTISFLQRDGDLKGRSRVVIDHDAATLAWLSGREADARVAYVFCTWDRLHFEVRRQRETTWDVLNPVALGDLLSLAANDEHELRLASPWVLAMQFSDADAMKGAEVWDKIARLEKDNLKDARLRAEARKFKDTWLEENARDPRTRSMQDAWERWKKAYLPSP
ncbi:MULTISPECIES: hypothetical protein [Sorangium]|uniref:Restriction endonuclease type IV Mrr domain-containing protein n=1 Tax=Sorangium cellulosum TaxID=56 RepID=A0A4P2QF44_SORCE|nr:MULTISPECIES: hypothetical protein [Sorangium]AUX28389.1 uncharacterized protein SOCE836_004590 [Sorangium cellulosum]WCQ87781.1 hypothetical protein NQZ70_00444 [Sorangium sp. Soce836]